MKILYMPLKKQWFEMIERGEKTEEYREIKPYYIPRFFEDRLSRETIAGPLLDEFISDLRDSGNVEQTADDFGLCLKDYDAVCFSYGYTKRRMTFECKGITIGHGRPEWGAPNHETFIIELGKRLQ